MEMSSPETVVPSAPSKESVERHIRMETTNVAHIDGNSKQMGAPTQIYLPQRQDDRPDGTNRIPRLAMRLGRGICYVYLALALIVITLFVVLVIVCIYWLSKSNVEVGTNFKRIHGIKTNIGTELDKQREQLLENYPSGR